MGALNPDAAEQWAGLQRRLAPLKMRKACVGFETWKESGEEEAQVVPRGRMLGCA